MVCSGAENGDGTGEKIIGVKGSVSIEWQGESLDLLPDRAVYWHKEKTLYIADTHFGKTATFRKVGTRNAQNYCLLKEIGQLTAGSSTAVLLKRGRHMASPNEFIASAEYLVAEGNPNVMLCPRGTTPPLSTRVQILDKDWDYQDRWYKDRQ